MIRRIVRSLSGSRPSRPDTRRPFEDFDGTWEDAQARAGGYDSSEILHRVLTASLAVAEGRAVHERDSVLFESIHYAWPVLASLLWSAACHGGQLRVLDVGGALGSSYRQNRRFIDQLETVSWAIVEQPMFVDAGRAHFHDERLSFYGSVTEALATRPNVALLSSVLQYLDDPNRMLESVSAPGIDTLIIDRTPVHDGRGDRLTIQHVPPSIYSATYAARILSYPDLSETLDRLSWTVVEEFPTLERPMMTRRGFPFGWTGLVCRRTEHPG